MRGAITCGMLGLAGLLGGCQYSGPVGGPGQVTVNWPLTVPPPPLTPPGVPPPAPPGVGPRDRPADGEYAGKAYALTNPGANCDNAVGISRWFVHGDQVDYQDFHGTIGPGGAVRMQFGDAYIIGTFRGSQFEGRYWRPQPGCTYRIVVGRVSG